MKFFDLHNDFLLKMKKEKQKNAYLKDKKLNKRWKDEINNSKK